MEMSAKTLEKAIKSVFRPDIGESVQIPQPGLYLSVVDEPVPRTPVVYPVALCFLAQGSKTVHIGPWKCSYNPGQFLLSRFKVTADSAAPDITKRKPLVGMALELNMPLLSQVIAGIGHQLPEDAETDNQPAVTAHPMEDSLLDILVRVVKASQDDIEWRVLSEGLTRELYFRLVMGPAGPLLRERAANVGNSSRVAAAIRFIERNLTEELGTEDIAKAAGVSVSGLHAKFKAVTGQAPMQFVKRMRLDHARTLLLSGESVTEAAYAAGYNSVSQFSREFSREYGVPPSKLLPH